MGEGGHEFFLFFKLHLKKGGARGFIYLLFFGFFIIYILLSHFLPPAGGEGGMCFIFLPFCYFLYCVLSFCYCFLLLPGEGGVGLFFIF